MSGKFKSKIDSVKNIAFFLTKCIFKAIFYPIAIVRCELS